MGIAIMASIIAKSCSLSNPMIRRAVFNASRSANLSTTAAVRFDDKKNIPEAYIKHKAKQEAMRAQMRIDGGQMIYLTSPGGGQSKKILFGFTLALTAYLMFECGKWFYIKSWPEKKD